MIEYIGITCIILFVIFFAVRSIRRTFTREAHACECSQQYGCAGLRSCPFSNADEGVAAIEATEPDAKTHGLNRSNA